MLLRPDVGCSASREEVDEHRANMTKAYEFALLQIGIAVDAAPLWWDYINFVRGRCESGKG